MDRYDYRGLPGNPLHNLVLYWDQDFNSAAKGGAAQNDGKQTCSADSSHDPPLYMCLKYFPIIATAAVLIIIITTMCV